MGIAVHKSMSIGLALGWAGLGLVSKFALSAVESFQHVIYYCVGSVMRVGVWVCRWVYMYYFVTFFVFCFRKSIKELCPVGVQLD